MQHGVCMMQCNAAKFNLVICNGVVCRILEYSFSIDCGCLDIGGGNYILTELKYITCENVLSHGFRTSPLILSPTCFSIFLL